MKKKIILTFMSVSILFGIAGCTSKDQVLPETAIVPQTENVTEALSGQTPATPAIDAAGEAAKAEASDEDAPDTDELFTGWLPDSVTQLKSETAPHKALQEKIIDYYEIPEEYFKETKYYYNYVDLNGDGTDEIFAVIIGSYVSGSGGNSALWCKETDAGIEILQAFTLVNTPIVVTQNTTDTQTGNAKSLLLQRSGGGADTEIVLLSCPDGIYTNVADAHAVENTDEIGGTAIICNNLITDMENGTYLTLADN